MSEVMKIIKGRERIPKSRVPWRPQLLSEDQMVQVASNFADGRIIDWTSPEAIDLTARQLSSPTSIINKALTTLALSNGPFVNKAFDILTKDLKSFKPDKSLFTSERAQEWWIKLSLGQSFIIVSELTASRDLLSVVPAPSSAKRGYQAEVKNQTDLLIKTLGDLKLADLTGFVAFEDIVHGWREKQSQTQKGFSWLKNTFDRNDMPVSYSYQEHLMAAQQDVWKKITVAWGWPQISGILLRLSSLRSTKTKLGVIAALESNLIATPPKSPASGDALDTKGVISLLNFRWREWDRERDALGEYFPSLAQELDKPLAADMLVPRKYFPTTAIELLTYVEPAFLEDIHKEVAGQPDVQTSWLLTLLALRTRKPSLGTFVDQALADLTGLSPHIHDILLNQQPGQLWLTSEGKISSARKGGFPIFTSSAASSASEEQPPLPQAEPEEKQPEVHLLFEQTTMPFLGQVNILRGEVQKFIGLMFQKGSLRLDLDKLYDQYELLSQKWRQATFDRSMLYLYPLNSQDLYMSLAKKINIEAVFIEKDNIYFVSTNNGNLEALAGRLDRQGQLHIQDTDSSFIGESEQLFLNNLALHLITQPLHESGIVKSYGKEDRSAINALAASWNRMQRGSLPKIGFSEKSAYIVARLEDGKVVLLGEVAKNG